MFRLLAIAVLATGLALASVGSAFADNPHNGSTGRPDVECEDFPGSTPGHSITARGSAFNPNGVGHNAYEAAGAEAQYDVACFQHAQHH